MQGLEREEHIRRLVQVEVGAGRGRQQAVPGDVVGVQVGIDHPRDGVAAFVGEGDVRSDVALGVDDGGFA